MDTPSVTHLIRATGPMSVDITPGVLHERISSIFASEILKQLQGGECTVLWCISHHAGWGDCIAFPSVNTIAKETGLCVRSVEVAIRRLSAFKLIAIGKRRTRSGSWGNQYEILTVTPRSGVRGAQSSSSPQRTADTAEKTDLPAVTPQPSSGERMERSFEPSERGTLADPEADCGIRAPMRPPAKERKERVEPVRMSATEVRNIPPAPDIDGIDDDAFNELAKMVLADAEQNNRFLAAALRRNLKRDNAVLVSIVRERLAGR